MSLKAKIEAVIYASEEPVTLAQLVGLLGEEGQAELDGLRSQQTLLALDEASGDADDADALNAEVLEAEAVPTTEPEVAVAEPEAEPAGETPVAAEPAPPSAEDEKKAASAAAAETKVRERALREHFRNLMDELIADYASDARGLEVREVAGGFRLATKPQYHDAVRGFVKSLKPPLKLTLQALETLAVVAYKQPVTAPEITEIRGVDSGGVLGGLMARKLVTTAGRKQVIGRPILYKTTKDFLVRFGLKDINELPSIEEFEKMAGELADVDPVQEEIPMPDDVTNEPRRSEETGDVAGEDREASGASSLDELNSAPEATTELHDSPEEMASDKSVEPEGHEREHDSADEVEPNADTHEAQADGTPDGSSNPADGS